MASNYESSDPPDPEFGTGDSRSEQLFADFDTYLAGITEVGGAAAYFAEAVEREQGVSAGDSGRVLSGEVGDEPFGEDADADDPDRAQGEPDLFDYLEEALSDGSSGEHDSPASAVAAERIDTPADPLATLRERSRVHVAEAANATSEAEKVREISQRTEAKAIELLDVPNRRGVSYPQALADVSRFAYEQDDLDSVRAVQRELQKQPDNGSQSLEYTQTNRALATAYFDGLSLGDVESEQNLRGLLEREQLVAEEKGGLVQDAAARGAALIRATEECIRHGLPSETYVDRYIEGTEGRWSVNFEALKNVAEEGGNEAASQQLQAHLRTLAQQEGFSDEYLRTTISEVLEHAASPDLKAKLLDRYHMIGTYRSNQSFENYRQLGTMAEALLADDAFMHAHPEDLYYLNEQLQEVAKTRLHERASTDFSQRQTMEHSSGEFAVATMIWGNSTPEVVSREIAEWKRAVVNSLDAEYKELHSVDDQGNLSEGIQSQIVLQAEGRADGMRAMAALQFFRKDNLEACSTMLASITNPQTQLDSYFTIWIQASTDQIIRTTQLEVAVAEDPTSPLVELQETALTLAGWDPDAIASRFEVLSDAVHEAGEAGQLLNNRIRLQHAQTEQLLDRLMKLDPSRAQEVAKAHLPKRRAGYTDFKRHRALEPYYRAITALGTAETYADVAQYISDSPDLADPQKTKQLAAYALQLQRVSKTLQALEQSD